MEAARQCSRDYPQAIQGTWIVTQEVVASLEANFDKLEELPSEGCCRAGTRIGNPSSWNRQYAGIVIDGKPLVYINAYAFAPEDFDASREPLQMCDGGLSFWGALFDSESKTFSKLSINADG